MPNTPGVPDHGAPVYDVIDHDTVEPKTKAGAVAAGGSAAVITPAVLWAIDEIWWGGGELDVPLPIVGVVGLVVSGLCALWASWVAPHVNRPQGVA